MLDRFPIVNYFELLYWNFYRPDAVMSVAKCVRNWEYCPWIETACCHHTAKINQKQKTQLSLGWPTVGYWLLSVTFKVIESRWFASHLKRRMRLSI